MSVPSPADFRTFVADDPLARLHLDALATLAEHRFDGTKSNAVGLSTDRPRVPSEDTLYALYAASDPGNLERVREITGAGDDGDGPRLVEVPAAELEQLRAKAAWSEDEQYEQFFGGR